MRDDPDTVGTVGDLYVVHRVIVDIGTRTGVAVMVLDVVERVGADILCVMRLRVYQHLVTVVIIHLDDDPAVVIALSWYGCHRNGVGEGRRLRINSKGEKGENEGKTKSQYCCLPFRNDRIGTFYMAVCQKGVEISHIFSCICFILNILHKNIYLCKQSTKIIFFVLILSLNFCFFDSCSHHIKTIGQKKKNVFLPFH